MPVPYQVSSDLVDPALELSLISAIASQPQTYFSVIEHLCEETFVVHAATFLDLAQAIEDGQEMPPFADLGEPAQDPEEAALKLQDLYFKRLLADHAQIFLMEIRKDRTAEELKCILESGIGKVEKAKSTAPQAQLSSVNDLLPGVLRKLTERYERAQQSENGLAGMSTGFKTLDKLTGGLSEALLFIAAPPGFGKTTFAINLALNVAKGGHPVVFCSYEEPVERLAGKGVASLSGLEWKRFEDGVSNPSSLELGASNHRDLLSNVFFLEGTNKTSVVEIRNAYRRAIKMSGAQHGLILIDYFQRAASNSGQGGEFRHTLEAYLKEVIDLLIKKEKACVVMLSAQNRSGQGSGSISSMRDGGDYDGDVIGVFTESDRHVPNPCRAVDLVIGKNRRGSIGTIPLVFDPALGQFEEAED